jgi:sialidase-1
MFLFMLTVVLMSQSLLAQSVVKEAGVPVFVSGHEGYACYRIPSVVRFEFGELLAFAEGRKYNCGDHGHVDVVMKRSKDDGETWSPLEVVHSESNRFRNVTIGNAAPTILHNGRVVLFYCRDNKQVYYMVSHDLGASWTSPVNITDQVVGDDWTWVATGPPASLQLESGRIVVPADRQSPTDMDGSFVFYSDDDLKTFQRGTLLFSGNECQATPLANGMVLLSMRPTGNEVGRGFAWSFDGATFFGSTWFPEQLVDPRCEGSVTTMQSGMVVLSNPCSATARENLCLHMSLDNGISWIEGPNLWTGPSGYSALVPLSHTEVGVFFETGMCLYTQDLRFRAIRV